MIRGFIFDLDGTLLDSIGAWRELDRRYLGSKGFTDIPFSLHETLENLDSREATLYLQRHYLPGLSEEEITREINEMIGEEYALRIPLKRGARELLDRYAHLPMGVATSCELDFAEAALGRLGVRERFAFILTTAQVGRDKTQPDLFLQAAGRLGLGPREVCLFEDAPYALRTAKAAGFYTVAVADETSSAGEELLRELSDQYLRQLSDFVMPGEDAK